MVPLPAHEAILSPDGGAASCAVLVSAREHPGAYMTHALLTSDAVSAFCGAFAQMTAACWPVGISSHTWMSCACTGSSIGMKALLFVSKSLAGTLYDLLTQGEILQAAKDEFARSLNGVKYISPFDE